VPRDSLSGIDAFSSADSDHAVDGGCLTAGRAKAWAIKRTSSAQRPVEAGADKIRGAASVGDRESVDLMTAFGVHF
jgi:hypothetical protein